MDPVKHLHLLSLLVAAFLASAAFFCPVPCATAADEAETEPEVKPDELNITLEPLVVNLNGRRGRYLRVVLQMELNQPLEEGVLERENPKIRSGLIFLLAAKDFDEIRTAEDKEYLRQEIVTKLNRILGRGTVNTIYFQDFLVQ